MQRVRITVAEMRELMRWIDMEKVEDAAVLEIMVSSSSGIGPSLEIKIETEKGQGIWKDLTDYESW